VKAKLLEIPMTEKELAVAVKCAQSTMHDLLNSAEAKHSSLVPAVHRVLGWDPPADPEAAPPIFSPDALEMAGLFDRLPEEVRRSMRDQAAAIVALLPKKPENQ
jgi:hypothetical protein